MIDLTQTKTHQLYFCAPWAEWIKGVDGWYSIPWTRAGMEQCIAGGGWFKTTLFGYHPRYRMSSEVVRPKKDKVEVKLKPEHTSRFNRLLNRLEGELTPVERKLLIEQLEAE